MSDIETQATTESAGYVTLEMLQAMSKESIFRRTTIARPRSFASEATEIIDDGFESDCDQFYDDNSSRRSAGSVSLEPLHINVHRLINDIVGGR